MSRQAATPAATLSAVMLKNIDNQTIDGEEKSKPEVIKLGLDLHARQVTECQKIRQELEQMVTEILPVGVGALSWITLQLEIRGWERFHNRRQVASYTGLCPGIHNSNGRGREGRINRCGNTIVRYTLIEMVWRLIRWQPDYPPIKKLRNALLSKRGKRRLIVAAARRLAIDLWRLATGRATAQELGLQLSNPTTALGPTSHQRWRRGPWRSRCA